MKVLDQDTNREIDFVLVMRYAFESKAAGAFDIIEKYKSYHPLMTWLESYDLVYRWGSIDDMRRMSNMDDVIEFREAIERRDVDKLNWLIQEDTTDMLTEEIRERTGGNDPLWYQLEPIRNWMNTFPSPLREFVFGTYQDRISLILDGIIDDINIVVNHSCGKLFELIRIFIRIHGVDSICQISGCVYMCWSDDKLENILWFLSTCLDLGFTLDETQWNSIAVHDRRIYYITVNRFELDMDLSTALMNVSRTKIGPSSGF